VRSPSSVSRKFPSAPPSIDALIAAIASRQHGAVRGAHLRAAGVTPPAISRRVARGTLHRRYHGVYAVGHEALSRDGEWLAAVFAMGDDAVLSHLSTGELRGVSRFRATLFDVTVPRYRRAPDGIRVHRVRRLDPCDVTTYRGIPTTTIHRLLVDLTDVLTKFQLANVLHEAAFRGWYVEAAVRDAMARANGRHNLAVLEQAIALHKSGSAGTRSRGEDAFLALMEHNLPEPLVNTDFRGYEVDFRWPDLQLIVEIDGSGHGREPTRLVDAGRDKALRGAEYTVLRFSDTDVFTRSADVRRATLAQAAACSRQSSCRRQ
jgi:hypothetical protein